MIEVNFFGTHEFAAEILKDLIASNKFVIKTIFTAPDRPVGRKQIIQQSPVKLIAAKHNLPTEQPETLKNFSFKNNAELNIVCQYGLIIPPAMVTAPKFCSINVHPSLLPKYRGASPIQSALLNGDTETGVTIILMDEKMDHGPILTQTTVPISSTDNYTTLSEKLLKTAKFLLLDTVDKWVLGEISPQKQDDSQATLCTIISRAHGRIDTATHTAEHVVNMWRAYTPWPGIWTEFKNKRIKFLDIIRAPHLVPAGNFVAENGKLFFGCKNSAIEILELQPEGKKPMPAKEFINGYQSQF